MACNSCHTCGCGCGCSGILNNNTETGCSCGCGGVNSNSCTGCNGCNGCNGCGNAAAGILFPDFVSNSCCNPCCGARSNYVTTGSCGCGCNG